MKFDDKHMKDWKEYHIKSKRISIKISRGNDYGNPKYETYNFDSEDDLNKALNDWLWDYDYIEEIIESDVYEFDYDKYSKGSD